jgi:DNA-binding response OmpR family regulator
MKGGRPAGIYEFGPFRVDAGQRLLLRGGTPIPILPKSFDALVALVTRSGQLLDKDALLGGRKPRSRRTASRRRSPISARHSARIRGRRASS